MFKGETLDTLVASFQSRFCTLFKSPMSSFIFWMSTFISWMSTFISRMLSFISWKSALIGAMVSVKMRSMAPVNHSGTASPDYSYKISYYWNRMITNHRAQIVICSCIVRYELHLHLESFSGLCASMLRPTAHMREIFQTDHLHSAECWRIVLHLLCLPQKVDWMMRLELQLSLLLFH